MLAPACIQNRPAYAGRFVSTSLFLFEKRNDLCWLAGARKWRQTTPQQLPIGFFDDAGVANHQHAPIVFRSEEHTSELQSLMRISYAVFCLKKKKTLKQILIRSHITCTMTQ